MSTLGSLVVSLEANIAKFSSDMGKTAYVAEQAMQRVQQVSDMAAKAVKVAFAGVAAAYSLDAFKSGIEGSIKAAAELEHLSDKTGATVEALSGLKSVAGLSGTSLDTVGTGLQRLSKSMYEAAAGNQQMVAQFKALGVPVTDTTGKLRDSSEVMLAVANRFADMDNGAQRVALAQKLFGKSGAELLPVLKDLADVGELNAKVTSEMAAQADQLEKNLIRLEARKKAIYNVLAQAVLPVFVDFTDALLASNSMVVNVTQSLTKMQKDGDLTGWARTGAIGVAYVIDGFDALYRIIKIIGIANAGVAAQIAELGTLGRGMVELFTGNIDKGLNTIKLGFDNIRMIGTAWLEDVDATLQRPTFVSKLEAEFAKRDAGLKKLKDRSAGAGVEIVTEAKTSAFENYLNELNRMLAKMEQSEYASMRLKAAQLAEKDALADLALAYDKIAKIQRAESQRAIDAYTDKLALENTQYAQQTDLLTLNAQQQDIATAAIKRRTEAEQMIIQARKSGKPLDDQAIADLKANTEAQIQAMTALIEARQNLERSFSYGTIKALQQYIDDSSNAAKQAQMVWGNAFKSMEDALVNFVQTGKLDFKGLVNSILADISRIYVQKNITQPLAQWLFGGGASRAGGADNIDIGGGWSPAGGGGSPASAISSWISSLLSFDVGTPYVPRDMLAQIHEGERIVPKGQNGAGGGGVTIVQHQTFQGGADPATLAQWGQQVKAATLAEVAYRMKSGSPQFA